MIHIIIRQYILIITPKIFLLKYCYEIQYVDKNKNNVTDSKEKN